MSKIAIIFELMGILFLVFYVGVALICNLPIRKNKLLIKIRNAIEEFTEKLLDENPYVTFILFELTLLWILLAEMVYLIT